MAQPCAGFFALPGLTMNLYDQYSLRVNDNPYKTLCLSLGGVHKTIQILDMLTPKTEFFAVDATRSTEIKPHNIKQYRFVRNAVKMLSPYSRVWGFSYDRSLLAGLNVYKVDDFLDGLEHVINHGVFVPENVYFQTMDRISLVRGDKKPGI